MKTGPSSGRVSSSFSQNTHPFQRLSIVQGGIKNMPNGHLSLLLSAFCIDGQAFKQGLNYETHREWPPTSRESLENGSSGTAALTTLPLSSYTHPVLSIQIQAFSAQRAVPLPTLLLAVTSLMQAGSTLMSWGWGTAGPKLHVTENRAIARKELPGKYSRALYKEDSIQDQYALIETWHLRYKCFLQVCTCISCSETNGSSSGQCCPPFHQLTSSQQ